MFNDVADGFQQKAVGGVGTASQDGFGETNNSNAFGSGIGFSTNTGKVK